ncbi:MAG: hypothetical protein HGA85_07980, partial [Nanoarchaeota archaeon]|nr:hypothetical protein [Nanoarchaeota archaeon]
GHHNILCALSEDTFPLQVDEKHVITGFDSGDAAKPSACKKSCLCICAKTCEHIVKCKDLESNDGREVKLAPIFFVAPEDAVREYILKKDEPTGKLTIEKKFSE